MPTIPVVLTSFATGDDLLNQYDTAVTAGTALPTMIWFGGEEPRQQARGNMTTYERRLRRGRAQVGFGATIGVVLAIT